MLLHGSRRARRPRREAPCRAAGGGGGGGAGAGGGGRARYKDARRPPPPTAAAPPQPHSVSVDFRLKPVLFLNRWSLSELYQSVGAGDHIDDSVTEPGRVAVNSKNNSQRRPIRVFTGEDRSEVALGTKPIGES